ncbi:MAG: pilus assembly PilX N-terminal domain-containing protein [Chlorobium sp.]|nr:pilus assembly PilX N-terminal domain-containing protein [Chlorobium sp.]
MFLHAQYDTGQKTSEAGFALIMAMVALLVLTLLGIWALNTSTFELKVAGGSQAVEKQFNVSEGAANTEAVNVGFVLQPYFQVSDPSVPDQLLRPTTNAACNPGNDVAAVNSLGNAITVAGIQAADTTTWPWRNMLLDYSNPSANNEFDYRYLVTYLYQEDRAFIGYGAEDFSAYKHRIQGGAASVSSAVVELGGVKMGPKSHL